MVAYSTVREPRRLPDGRIACLVKFDLWPDEQQFVADRDDVTAHGKEIFERAERGDFGLIKDIEAEGLSKLPPAAAMPIGSVVRPTGAPVPKHWPEIDLFLAEMNREISLGSDRGLALTSTAMVETLLKRLLAVFLVDGEDAEKLLEPTGALGEFRAATRMGVALGLFSRNLSARLAQVGKIRNEFAHKIGMGFDDGAMPDRVRGLLDEAARDATRAMQTRVRFSSACVTICLELADAAYLAEKQKRIAAD